MAAQKPYRPKMTAAEKKAYKGRNFGEMGKTGGMGGKYGRKAENLTKKELKAAGGLAASKKRTVDIGQTSRDTSRGITLGPGGKPLTGSVKMADGSIAVYKGGKRVQAAAPASKSKSTSTGSRSSATSKPKTTRVSPSARGEGAGSSKGSTTSKGKTPSHLTGMSVNKPGTYVPATFANTNLRGRSAKNPYGARVSATGMKKPTGRGKNK